MVRKVKSSYDYLGFKGEVEVELPDAELPEWGDPKTLSVVGKDFNRKDGAEKVTGNAKFASDLQLPGMLFAKFLRSPHPHARIKKIDVSKAKALPGVMAIMTHEDAPKIKWYGDSLLLDPVLRFEGDEVAAVAAVNDQIAEDALRLINVEYEILPHVVDPEEAMKEGAPKIHEEGNVAGGKPYVYERGDVSKGFAEADVVIEDTFRSPVQFHACMETHGAVADWSGDKLTLYASTQGIFRVRNEAAELLGIPISNVRVISQHTGGGFGSKNFCNKYDVAAALLSKQTGRPVRMCLDRREEFLATGIRPATIQTIKIGAKKDGTLTAIQMNAIGNLGAHIGISGVFRIGFIAGFLDKNVNEHYACPNVKSEIYSVYTNTPVNTPWRAPGTTEASCGLEPIMDMLAEKLGMDPMALRMKNYSLADQVGGNPYTSKALDKCYGMMAKAIGWEKRNKKPGEGKGPKKRGIGMSSMIWFGFSGPPAFAIVKLNSDGTAHLVTGTEEIGCGARLVLPQIAAEELGMKYEDVSIALGDTDNQPYTNNTWGSITVTSLGPAIRLAANDAKKQLLQVAAPILEANADDLDAKDGMIFVKSKPDQKIPIKEACKKMGDNMIIGRGSRGPNPATASITIYGATAAEVEVDTETGDVKVLKFASAHDIGRVISPKGASNQVIGGVVQGLGYGLGEQMVMDKSTGIMVNANMHNYQIPTMVDAGEIIPLFPDMPDPAFNIGTKGLGEPPIVTPAGTIANAVYNATGVRIKDLPVTPDKILKAL